MPSTCAPGVQVTEVRGGNLHVDLADRLEDIGGVEFHTGALDAGRGDTHMGLAGAAEDGLAGRLPVVYCRGWVLDDEPVQRSRQPVLIGLLHGGDRHAVHRERERRYDDRHRPPPACHRVAGTGVGKLGHRHDVTRRDAVDAGLRGTRQRQHVVQPLLRTDRELKSTSSARIVPETTLRIEIWPRNSSIVVLNTNASSAPSGSGAISIVPPAASATVGPSRRVPDPHGR